jgi:hypothetical protein
MRVDQKIGLDLDGLLRAQPPALPGQQLVDLIECLGWRPAARADRKNVTGGGKVRFFKEIVQRETWFFQSRLHFSIFMFSFPPGVANAGLPHPSPLNRAERG